MSPDGRWVAYASNEEDPQRSPGRTRVYARTFPEPGRRFTVSDSLGSNPSRDGRTIYYGRARTLVTASVQTTPTFSVTARRDLFTVATPTPFLNYDVSPEARKRTMHVARQRGQSIHQDRHRIRAQRRRAGDVEPDRRFRLIPCASQSCAQ